MSEATQTVNGASRMVNEGGKVFEKTAQDFYESGKNYINKNFDAHKMQEKIQATLQETIPAKMQEAVQLLKSRTGHLERQISGQVKQNPWRAVALGLTAGFICGRLLRD